MDRNYSFFFFKQLDKSTAIEMIAYKRNLRIVMADYDIIDYHNLDSSSISKRNYSDEYQKRYRWDNDRDSCCLMHWRDCFHIYKHASTLEYSLRFIQFIRFFLKIDINYSMLTYLLYNVTNFIKKFICLNKMKRSQTGILKYIFKTNVGCKSIQ